MDAGNKSRDGSDEFQAVYAEHAPMVRGVLYNICGGEELDDLVQDAFIKVWKGLRGFRRDSGIKTWIYRIAANTALDHCRKRPSRLLETELDESLHSGVGGTDAGDNADLVHKGVLRLSPEHRAVVTLCVFEELSVKQAAETLGLPEGTVKSRLYYAKTELAKFFNSSGVAA